MTLLITSSLGEETFDFYALFSNYIKIKLYSQFYQKELIFIGL